MVRFTTKKIDSLTMGERMKKLRDERRLSLAEISKSTKIQTKYLEYLEDGEYARLPADVYVKGFLRSYAIFMGFNEAMFIKQYEREKGINKNIKKIYSNEITTDPIKFSYPIITPKIIIISSVIFMVIGGFAYLYKEVNNFISVPRLAIIQPADGMTINGNSTYIEGIAEKDARVFINDYPILVNENGEFREDVGLKIGLNIISVKAQSKFGKEAVKTISVNANFQDQQSLLSDKIVQDDSSVDSEKPISAQIHVAPNETWLSVEADGNLVYSGLMLPQAEQNFTAQKIISVTSGKGNETFVKINGKDMGNLSSESGVVRNVQFNAEGKIN